MMYTPTKVLSFSRECLARGLAVVVVGFPATPLLLSRARFCASAAMSRAQLDEALDVVEGIVRMARLRYQDSVFG
jgi:serine palmitoyltransferase